MPAAASPSSVLGAGGLVHKVLQPLAVDLEVVMQPPQPHLLALRHQPAGQGQGPCVLAGLVWCDVMRACVEVWRAGKGWCVRGVQLDVVSEQAEVLRKDA